MSPTTIVRGAPTPLPPPLINERAGGEDGDARAGSITTQPPTAQQTPGHLPRGATVIKDFAPKPVRTSFEPPPAPRAARGPEGFPEEDSKDDCRNFNDAGGGVLPPRINARRRRGRAVAARLRHRPRG